MRRIISSIFLMTVTCSMIIGQEGLSVKIVESDIVEKKQCIDLQVSNESSEMIHLSSQNYRMYYGSANLSLIEESMSLNLPEEIYQLKLVQHVSGVDAQGRGALDFDNNLGFINFSIVHNNIKQKGSELSKDALSIVEMCFSVEDPSEPMSIVLAREETTAAYGRAYIELSAQNKVNELKSTEISQYKDFIVR